MNSIDRQYKELLEHILHFGVDKEDRTGTGTKSIFGWQLRHNMKDGFPLLTTKKMAFKTMVVELLWFLRGDTNIKYLVDNDCHIWDGDAYKNYCNHFLGHEDVPDKNWFINEIKNNSEFAKQFGGLGPIYGKQWRDWGGKDDVKITEERDENGFLKFETIHNQGIDQIQNLINEIKKNPNSRRLIVNAWNIDELNKMVLPPCHYGFQCWTRELTIKERLQLWDKIPTRNIMDFPTGPDKEKEYHEVLDKLGVQKRAISLMWNQRSVDTFLGLPFNIASYALLLKMIAKEVDMVPDELIGNLGDCHLYNNHIEQAKEQVNRTPYELPEVIMRKACSITGEREYTPEDITLINYEYHPQIKASLSN